MGNMSFNFIFVQGCAQGEHFYYDEILTPSKLAYFKNEMHALYEKLFHIHF